MLRSTLAILFREKAIPFSVNDALKKLDNVKLVELNGKVMKESMGEGSELLSQIKMNIKYSVIRRGKMNKVRSLEEILHRCAVLRCVATLQHRTLHEFDWFVSACIWGKDGSYGEKGTEVYRIYSDRTSFRLDSDDGVLVKWAELFEEYCVKEYGDDAKI